MTRTEQLLADCEQHGAFLWMRRGRWFIALGEFMAVGNSLEEAVENWCQQVEAHPRFGPKVSNISE